MQFFYFEKIKKSQKQIYRLLFFFSQFIIVTLPIFSNVHP